MRDAIGGQRWYKELISLAGGQSVSPGISFDMFRQGLTIFAFNLEHNDLSSQYSTATELGNLQLNVNFESPLTVYDQLMLTHT